MLPKTRILSLYTIRVVSKLWESNGFFFDGNGMRYNHVFDGRRRADGKPVAGIAMGLIKEDDGRVAVLTDILGDEDHLGDMDFKVAGTKDGVTALQMEIKITSITKEIMQTALAQAHEGRIHILGEMAKAIAEPRPHVSDRAPRIIAIKIPVDKIREVIGSGGKVIREITEKTNTKIDIADDGVIKIASVKKRRRRGRFGMDYGYCCRTGRRQNLSWRDYQNYGFRRFCPLPGDDRGSGSYFRG